MALPKNLSPFIIPLTLCLALASLAYTLFMHAMLALAALIIILRIFTRHNFIALLIPILSAYAIAHHFHTTQHAHTRWYEQFNHKTATLSGAITDIKSVNHPRYSTRITLNTHTINNEACSGNFFIYTSGQFDGLPGDLLSAHMVKINCPKNSDYRRYLAKEGIQASCFLPKRQLAITPQNSFSLARFLHNKTNDFIRNCKQAMNRATFAWFSSLFLGDKGVDLYKTRGDFQLWGISHFLARSGLHLVIFIMLLSFLLRFVPIPYRAKNIVVITICSMYIALSFSSISMYRAFFTLIAYTLWRLTYRQIHAMHTLSIVTLLIIIYNPAQAFFLDFQLSFGITFLLLWYTYLNKSYNAAKRRESLSLPGNP